MNHKNGVDGLPYQPYWYMFQALCGEAKSIKFADKDPSNAVRVKEGEFMIGYNESSTQMPHGIDDNSKMRKYCTMVWRGVLKKGQIALCGNDADIEI